MRRDGSAPARCETYCCPAPHCLFAGGGSGQADLCCYLCSVRENCSLSSVTANRTPSSECCREKRGAGPYGICVHVSRSPEATPAPRSQLLLPLCSSDQIPLTLPKASAHHIQDKEGSRSRARTGSPELGSAEEVHGAFLWGYCHQRWLCLLHFNHHWL